MKLEETIMWVLAGIGGVTVIAALINLFIDVMI